MDAIRTQATTRSGASVTRDPASGASSDPFLAALVDLLLPERDLLLQRVDSVLAGGERVLPVRRRDGDHNGGAADLDAAGAVVDGDLAKVVALLQRGGDLGHDVLRHPLVRLVIQVLDHPAAR